MWGALGGLLVQIVGSFVGKALLSLGVGYVAYKGMDLSIAFAKTKFMSSVGGFGAVTIQLMGVLNVGTAVNILCSALIARLAFKGMVGGIMKAAKLN